MLAAVAIALAVPWLTPVSFGWRVPGWHVGQSGTHYELVGHAHTRTPFSTAWVTNVRCRDCGTSNPPNATLQQFPRRGIIVWASIQPPDPTGWPPTRRRLSRNYSLTDAYHFPCCEATLIGGGAWELYGFGQKRTYSVLIRVYWGSPPTRAMKAVAQRAIRTLRLPQAR
jgi:hypothetical protein